MIPNDRYPIGQQDFKTLRNSHALYIDKTVFVEKLAKSKSGYYFLARPRRFGKSLFLSTLKYFFKGERELFKGLYIDSTDWNWDAYPVLYLDLNTDRFADQGAFEDVLETLFMEWESKYDVKEVMVTFSQRFKTIIRRAYEKTGKQVVIPPKAALAQIEDKEYALRFQTDPRKIFCIGVNFSADKRRIESWKIAE